MNFKIKSIIILFLFSGIISAATQIKVACIGNSITQNSTYVVSLLKLLGSTGYKVENDGISGTTLLKKGDHPYWVEGKFKQVFALQPNIVTIKLGTNDTKLQNWDSHCGEFKRDYLAMIDTLNTLASKPKIWIVLPVPIFPNTYGIRDSALQKIMVILKQIGQERGLPVVDANTPLKNFRQYFSDGVHPNAAGSDTIAHVIYRALTSTVSVQEPALPTISGVSSDIHPTRDKHSFSILSPGAAKLQILDLRGGIIYTQTIPAAGRHFIYANRPLHGHYLIRVRREGLPDRCDKIILP